MTLGILLTHDVARILTEEAQAKTARTVVVRKLQPAASDTADLLPDTDLPGVPDGFDEAVATVRSGLRAWARRQLADDMGEAAVEQSVTDLRHLLGGGQLGRLDGRNPHVKAARRELDRARRLVEQEWEGRKRSTVSRASVGVYLDNSWPATPDRPSRIARFAKNPIPAPRASRDRAEAQGVQGARGREQNVLRQPMWYAEQEQELRDWYRNLPGPGVGGGRPRTKTRTTDK